jgi:hypothetical protein
MIEYYNKPVTKYGNFFCFYLDEENFLLELQKLIEDNVGKLDNQTNVKGQMTSWHFFRDLPIFLDFLNILVPYFDKFKIPAWDNCLPMFSVRDGFGNILKKNDCVDSHNHMGSVYSSCLYFDDYADLHTEAGTFKTQRGKVITLPGWCNHWVDPIKQDVKRYTLVWNWNPVNEEIVERDKKDALKLQ